jgi:cation transport ATPase
VRSMGASLASAIASLAIPFAVFLSTFLKGSAGDHDDAPFRASGALLMLSPLYVIIGTAWFMVSTWALRRFGKLTLRSLVTLSLVASLLFGVFAAVDRVDIGGLGDAAFSFLVFGTIAFVCLSLGSCVWWLVRPAA